MIAMTQTNMLMPAMIIKSYLIYLCHRPIFECSVAGSPVWKQPRYSSVIPVVIGWWYSQVLSRIFLASSESSELLNTAERRLSSAEVSSLDTLVVPLSAESVALPFSPMVSVHSFMAGNKGFKSTWRLLTDWEISFFFSSSDLLSICTASASKLIYMEAIISHDWVSCGHADTTVFGWK